MRRLLALIFAVTLWFSFAPPASADFSFDALTPCAESPAFQQRAKSARATTDDPASGKKRFERYSQALCGKEGLPHLIVDGRWSRAGDFLIPSVLFLYIAGWIGWVGRSYLIDIKKGKNPEEKEIIIDVPLAVSKMLTGFAWPLTALKDMTSGEMFAKDDEIPVSPR
ncbi:MULTISPECIES: Photosystem I reaction center subunit III [unclassified Coleofasciculus]|uniref:Photosystem I reaction center subunit III n=1 Tax=unclassified Coleofasciculus TaxID=2692782 RepID=UPI00187FA2DA|nr:MULTISPECIES: Photosystem I reaction center subunit III [unclassified Coleofasciculus]MBE9127225.1 Photosystem I reaction center subunit III [Coleofasciculus sp. LEGE 07081]MBE9150517.1 Photosystem I reaction center subunit III [Coleofasciculus sp. LEGE 07092]